MRGRGHKYHAQPTEIDGVRFASKKESRRYLELKVLEKIGEISGLTLQPAWKLFVFNVTGQSVAIGEYRADFSYVERGAIVVEDVKSPATRTAIYRWKIKHLRAQYGIEVRET